MARILITDDQTDLRRLIRWSLESGDNEIEEATNGNEALLKARSMRPDLMVLDVMMPGDLNGLQVCRMVKSDPGLAHIPIVLLSARGQVSDIREGTEAGADGYVIKPFSPQRLAAVVADLLAREQATESAGSQQEGPK